MTEYSRKTDQKIEQFEDMQSVYNSFKVTKVS